MHHRVGLSQLLSHELWVEGAERPGSLLRIAMSGGMEYRSERSERRYEDIKIRTKAKTLVPCVPKGNLKDLSSILRVSSPFPSLESVLPSTGPTLGRSLPGSGLIVRIPV